MRGQSGGHAVQSLILVVCCLSQLCMYACVCVVVCCVLNSVASVCVCSVCVCARVFVVRVFVCVDVVQCVM